MGQGGCFDDLKIWNAEPSGGRDDPAQRQLGSRSNVEVHPVKVGLNRLLIQEVSGITIPASC